MVSIDGVMCLVFNRLTSKMLGFFKKYFVAEILFFCCVFICIFQQPEEMYDPEIYRHQIAEYYNPYVLETDIQAGEFYFNITLISWEHGSGWVQITSCSLFLLFKWVTFKCFFFFLYY